jgi:hypothetical protein
MTYQEVTVKETFTDMDTGRVKKATKRFLVDAMSATEAEAKTIKMYEGSTVDFKVTATKESNISEIIS